MSKLLSPIKIKGLTIKNRIVMPPMASEMGTNLGRVTQDNVKYYEKRAEAQTGLIIVEHSYVNPKGRYSEKQLTIQDDESIEGYKRIVDVIHRYGAKAALQITHAGSMAKKEIIGCEPVAPSAVKHPNGEDIPRELTIDEIKEIVNDFAKAARRAREAGFDMVEIHGAHGYLLNQFYSPLTNKRQDGYGGTRENRLKLALEIVEAVKSQVGGDCLIAYRLGADDRMEGGLTLEDGVYAAKKLEAAGVDVLDISGGLCGSRPQGMGPGYFVYMAEEIKPQIGIPTIITGGIKTPELAEKIVAEAKSDMVGIGRAMLKDPRWSQKAIEKLS